MFDKIVVSSDGYKILDISKKYGVDIYKRPKNLSTDKASLFSSVRDYLTKDKYSKWDKVCCLLPASPLIYHKDIIKGFKLLNKNKFIIPITEYDFPIQKSLIKNNNGQLNYIYPKVALKTLKNSKKLFMMLGNLLGIF